ncbi:heterokaryon incompatibility protein Het-C-domain-containing protein [Xylogone sp. PMI_703]|nr:heterokaryon incompatibility protein Het-C-domain-containing protein [Xylogone sp. PMI_703]
MPSIGISTAVLTLALLLLLAHPAHAFGAGNIASLAKVEGVNWRHGDIEDTLLNLLISRAAGGKKFDKLMVSRVYFGNWLRDYSQAIDVGTVKYVSAEAIRILLWVLGFMTFGYGTREFEVTAERLGCYRPEDHIDNPKDYADNLDARQYDRRLRGPVDERVELAIDQRTGMKNYIANERAGIMTSALHVRKLFAECIRLGRSYNHSRNSAELYEALRLMGTGLHCLEDFSAHSNYTELALIELGERDVFPHVGRRTQIELYGARQPVYPLITGTFGGVDFLHSVMGEFSDKATQSEIQGLENTMEDGRHSDNSLLKSLLNSIPSGIFGSDESSKADELQANATAAQMESTHISPREPEEFTRQMQDIAKQIYPIMEWHDNLMKQIREAIEKIPVLPQLIEQLEDQVNIFVFSLLAPFVIPIIDQIKTELNTGSSEVIQSSKAAQLIVFNDDHSTDPTHSMLSKDHFSNVLNEPAGKIASEVLKWVVPQLMQCWDDERIDVDRTINRIIEGVFHHPAQRDYGDDGAVDGRRAMFSVVEQWWRSKDYNEQEQFRRQLSRDGVMNGENHKEGVQDSGHGCGKPLGMAKGFGGGSTVPGHVSSGGGGGGDPLSKFVSEAAGGGALGALAGSLLGGVSGSSSGGRDTYSSGGGRDDYSSSGRDTYGGGGSGSYGGSGYPPQGGHSEYRREEYSSGGGRAEYKSYEERDGREVRSEYQTYDEDDRHKHGHHKHKSRGSRGSDDDSDDDERRERHHEGRHEEARGYEEYRSREGYPPQGGYERHEERREERYGGEYGGGYERREERHEERYGGEYGGGYQERREERYEERGYGGHSGGYQESYQQGGYGGGGGYEQRGYGGGGGYQSEYRQEYAEPERESSGFGTVGAAAAGALAGAVGGAMWEGHERDEDEEEDRERYEEQREEYYE